MVEHHGDGLLGGDAVAIEEIAHQPLGMIGDLGVGLFMFDAQACGRDREEQLVVWGEVHTPAWPRDH